MITLELTSLLAVVALGITWLLIVKLWIQQTEDLLSKVLLIGLLIGLAAMVLNQLFFYAELWRQWPHYSYVGIVFMYGIGPNFYWYVRRTANNDSPTIHRRWYLHWSLMIIALLYFLIRFYFLPAEVKVAFLETERAQGLSFLVYAILYLQMLIYIIACRKPLLRYNKTLLDNFSDTTGIDLRWLRQICYAFLTIIILDLFMPMIGIVPIEVRNVLLATASLYLICFCFSALDFNRYRSGIDQAGALVTEKYQRTGLSKDKADEYLERLEQSVVVEKHYLNPDISLKVLAQKLDVRPHHLSQLLNERLNKNFYDYINEQRVTHAKQLLSSDNTVSIIDVTFESGFGSKASFYNTFKRIVGMTPLQYKKQQKTQLSREI